MIAALHTPRLRFATTALVLAFLGAGLFGAWRYIHAYDVYRGFPPPVDPKGVAAGHIGHLSFYSPALRRRDYVVVYTPPGYARAAAAGRRFPVLYLLPAPVGHPEGYFKAGGVGMQMDVLLHQRRVRPFLIVVPFGRSGLFSSDTEWANARAGRYESFVVDAARAVDRHYAAIRNRRARAVGGLSMGGYAGPNITLHQLRVFGNFESWSGYFIQTATGPFQGLPQAELRANSPLYFAPRVARSIRRLGLRAFIYQGNHDDVPLGVTTRFVHELWAEGARVRFRIFPGKHNWRLWRQHLPDALEWASSAFGRVR